MAVEVTREEFKVLEREVEGEKMVTRHILEQTRRNGDDLAAIRTRMDRLEQKVDSLKHDFDGLKQDFDGLKHDVNGLTKALPTVVADVMREVLKEHDKGR